MRVLVAYATRHAATAGIADAVAAVLRREGAPLLQVDVVPADEVGSVDEYDAVVIGSAVYLDRWLGPARELARTHADQLRLRPVWLFSSGPLGEPAAPLQDAADGPELADALGALGHRTFPGALRLAELGRGERLAVRLVHAPEGDYRDWLDVRHWAEDIVDTLTAPAEAVRAAEG